MELDELPRESDIVSLHVRPNDNTRGMIGEPQLRMMKPSAYLINTARAGLVNLEAFCRALRERWITGAAVDVYESEPVKLEYPLLALDNVTVTNHRAGETRNSYWVAPLLMGAQSAKLLRGETPEFIANPEVLTRKSRLTD